MTQSQELYLNTKPSKLFWKAALLGGIAMLASSLYTIFDTLFIGKLIGTEALAALGLAMPLIIINFALSELVGVGSPPPSTAKVSAMKPWLFFCARTAKRPCEKASAAALLAAFSAVFA